MPGRSETQTQPMTMSIPSARWFPLVFVPLASCIFVVGDGSWDGSLAFSNHHVRGSGVRAEADREVGEFRAVELETCATVLVRVGEAPSVHLAGDDNLLPLVETKVEHGVLTLDVRDSCSFRSGLEVVIGTPSLERFTIAGSGDVMIQGLAADQVKLAIEGSGTLSAQGTARALVGSIEGSGELRLAELAAEEADLSIEGSGAMHVQVTNALRYSIEGSGDIRYAGTPELRGEIDGSGNIEKSR